MLLNACSLLPKSTFVCGNSATTAGLTVSLTHDPVSNDYVADAGALVISDNGLCCIDEFDKLENPTSLLEVMEDQMVSVAKGGVVCKVPARTTIIAAANPKFGHYDASKKIKENIRFKQQVISRFDLVYLLRENVNEDYNVSENIIKKFRKEKKEAEESRKYGVNLVGAEIKDDLIDFVRNDSLSHLLRVAPTIYEQELLKKYILYARNVVNPVLTAEAKTKLQNYYVRLRKNENITIRDLESLMRLTEAKAKMELRNIASKKDAEIIIQLYEKTLFKEREQTIKKVDLLEYLKDISAQGQNIFSTHELNSFIERLGLKKPAEQIISNMNNQGYLIKKGKNQYEFRC
ncbi:DNA replication licensing factor, MCM6 component [Trachipleistophora hominis]|uniref:DNA replication licensing factor, MCM6 component n=1 Tax=Trachipleistophora hominis TaxID=72359 RepID=L7JY78_TRAHO|nr:DNA replication licensing factor, MCM6 component [Trachipleistophora hominis]